MVRNINTNRKYEKILQQILELIENGKLEPGDRLPSERDLAEELKCSRSSLREAIRVLESKGLLVSKLGGGRYVQDIDQQISVNHPYNRIATLEKTAILQFLEARETIEPKIAELASLRATNEDLEKMEKLLSQMKLFLKQSDEHSAIDSSFHMALAESTQNFVFVSMMEANLQMIQQVRKQTLVSDERPDQAFQEHWTILEAIKKRNPEQASKVTKDHLHYLKERVLGNF